MECFCGVRKCWSKSLVSDDGYIALDVLWLIVTQDDSDQSIVLNVWRAQHPNRLNWLSTSIAPGIWDAGI